MMFRLLSLVATIAIVIGATGTSAFSRSAEDAVPSAATVKPKTNPAPATKEKNQPNLRLKGDMEKLLAAAKAGKVAPRSQQTNYPKRNNLSTGAKIGIIAAIAGGIFAIWVIHTVNSD